MATHRRPQGQLPRALLRPGLRGRHSQAAHHLAEHVSVRGLAEFAVILALIRIAWVNGSLYLELHGREDGRTRSIVVVQMGILVLLAVFTAEAADGSGPAFAVVYATFQVLQTGALVHGLASEPS
jgi:low temperature requirement protein LtrA